MANATKHLSHLLALCMLLGLSSAAFAQFSGTVSGVVLDSTGAIVPGAALTLRDNATNEQRTTVSSESGVYQFVSLKPGSYELSVTMKGFATTKTALTLETNQTLNVPFHLTVGSTETIEVTSQAPLLDSADTRLQETLPTETLSALPLAGRSMISLVTLAPGVTGTGVTSNGSPGSGRDNFSTETQVDASANGQGAVGNMYIVDGLDVSSSIRPGVLNMTPNPDSIQEATIQTNTYNVDYGRSSSIQMTMTTKSGTNHYHGNASDYFTYQKFLARTEFTQKYNPFHSNNISASIGGPIIPHRDAGFFFFAIEPYRASNAVSSNITFNDPAFAAWAATAFPNTVGTKLLNTYPVSNVSNVQITQTAASVYPVNTKGNPICGTPSTFNLPCSTPILDSGNYGDTAYRNGDQYNVRIDKGFGKERLYGTYYRTTLNSNTTNPRAAFKATNTFSQYAIQVNETHTFSPSTLNEASFAAMRVEGVQPATGLFSVPVVNVTGGGQGFGSGFAQGDFIQHNYHWRDVLTHTFRSHNVRAGYEGLFADDVEVFDGPYDQPTFAFNSLLDLARDNVFTESGVAYDPISGQKTQYSWDAAGITQGAFIEDTWKINRKVTLNYGLRWDDFGNPYQRTPSTAFGNFFLGPGPNLQTQTANGSVVAHHHALNRSITDVFSPRAGVAWDPAGDGKWVVKGGAGFFHNWPTLANVQEQYRGNPPGNIFPTFFGAQPVTPTNPAPIFGLGTSNNKPFNFPYPVLPARPLNSQGGITGLQFNIGGIDPNLISPVTYTYSTSLDHEIARRFVASLIYTGATGRNLLSGGGQVFSVSYGQDINRYDGDLIQHGSVVPTRLNTSFGQVNYTQNDRVSNYNAFIAVFRGRFSRAFFNASYTRSASNDDTQVYPTNINPHQYYAPSIWDTPNRFSLAWNYEFPSYNNGEGFVGRIATGWQLSGTTILQNGNPITVSTNAPFKPSTDSNGVPIKDANGRFVGTAPGSGDFNADGDNRDYPDVISYNYKNSRQDYLHGIFTTANFPTPAFGTEGNERYSAFRAPGFQQWDTALLKNTPIHESISFQFRFEIFNFFNHPNLTNVDVNLPDGNFGKATGQATPRLIQLGGNLTF